MYRAIMRVFVFACLFSTCVVLAANASNATSPAPSGGLKIGVANLQIVAKESKANKDAERKLKETFSADKDSLEKMNREIEKLTGELKKQSSALSKEALQARRAQLMQMMGEYSSKRRDFVDKVNDAENVSRREILAAILIGAKEYAEKHGYSMIVDSSAQSVVLYADETMDVTKDLLKETDLVWETAAKKKGKQK